VKISVAAVQLNAPWVTGSMLNAASALARSTSSEKMTSMLVVVSATASSVERWCVRPMRSTDGARPSTVLATYSTTPRTASPTTKAATERRLAPRTAA
jgi:hypothetical protein